MKKIKEELITENGKVYKVTTYEVWQELRGESLQKQLSDLQKKQEDLLKIKEVVDENELKEKARKEAEEKEKARLEKEEKEKNKPE